MRLIHRLLDRVPATTAHAHCDLPCGIYDPAQARIDTASVITSARKAQASDDADFKARATIVRVERAEAVKHHLWVLWTDYFKPEHAERFPQLHDLFWRATKAAGAAKQSADPAKGVALLALVDEIGALFAETKPGYDYASVQKNTDLQIG